MSHSQLPATIIIKLWFAYQQRALLGGLLAGAVVGFVTAAIVDACHLGLAGRLLVLVAVLLAGLVTSYFAFKAALETLDSSATTPPTQVSLPPTSR